LPFANDQNRQRRNYQGSGNRIGGFNVIQLLQKWSCAPAGFCQIQMNKE
jgi:hypothetical protein